MERYSRVKHTKLPVSFCIDSLIVGSHLLEKSSPTKHRSNVFFIFILNKLLFENFEARQISGGLIILKRYQKTLETVTGDGRHLKRIYEVGDVAVGVQYTNHIVERRKGGDKFDLKFTQIKDYNGSLAGSNCSVDGRDPLLKARKPWVSPDDFSINFILPAALWPWI
jgi:hypothetical protein